MIEPTEAPKPAKKKRRKPARAAAKKAAPAAKTSDEFAGMTTTACPTTCNVNGCAISGRPFCGHPCKGAQIPPGDVGAMNRLKAARKALGLAEVEKRFD